MFLHMRFMNIRKLPFSILIAFVLVSMFFNGSNLADLDMFQISEGHPLAFWKPTTIESNDKLSAYCFDTPVHTYNNELPSSIYINIKKASSFKSVENTDLSLDDTCDDVLCTTNCYLGFFRGYGLGDTNDILGALETKYQIAYNSVTLKMKELIKNDFKGLHNKKPFSNEMLGDDDYTLKVGDDIPVSQKMLWERNNCNNNETYEDIYYGKALNLVYAKVSEGSDKKFTLFSQLISDNPSAFNISKDEFNEISKKCGYRLENVPSSMAAYSCKLNEINLKDFTALASTKKDLYGEALTTDLTYTSGNSSFNSLTIVKAHYDVTKTPDFPNEMKAWDGNSTLEYVYGEWYFVFSNGDRTVNLEERILKDGSSEHGCVIRLKTNMCTNETVKLINMNSVENFHNDVKVKREFIYNGKNKIMKDSANLELTAVNDTPIFSSRKMFIDPYLIYQQVYNSIKGRKNAGMIFYNSDDCTGMGLEPERVEFLSKYKPSKDDPIAALISTLDNEPFNSPFMSKVNTGIFKIRTIALSAESFFGKSTYVFESVKLPRNELLNPVFFEPTSFFNNQRQMPYLPEPPFTLETTSGQKTLPYAFTLGLSEIEINSGMTNDNLVDLLKLGAADNEVPLFGYLIGISKIENVNYLFSIRIKKAKMATLKNNFNGQNFVYDSIKNIYEGGNADILHKKNAGDFNKQYGRAEVQMVSGVRMRKIDTTCKNYPNYLVEPYPILYKYIQNNKQVKNVYNSYKWVNTT